MSSRSSRRGGAPGATHASGEANRVAVAIDRLAWPDVVGTIAGDDTIFIAVKDGGAQRRVMREVRRLGTA